MGVGPTILIFSLLEFAFCSSSFISSSFSHHLLPILWIFLLLKLPLPQLLQLLLRWYRHWRSEDNYRCDLGLLWGWTVLINCGATTPVMKTKPVLLNQWLTNSRNELLLRGKAFTGTSELAVMKTIVGERHRKQNKESGWRLFVHENKKCDTVCVCRLFNWGRGDKQWVSRSKLSTYLTPT